MNVLSIDDVGVPRNTAFEKERPRAGFETDDFVNETKRGLPEIYSPYGCVRVYTRLTPLPPHSLRAFLGMPCTMFHRDGKGYGGSYTVVSHELCTKIIDAGLYCLPAVNRTTTPDFRNQKIMVTNLCDQHYNVIYVTFLRVVCRPTAFRHEEPLR